MPSESDFNEQVTRFHNQIVELIKKYQFRDRNRDICCGLSVSQCYVLDTLRQSGPLSMNELAEKMRTLVSMSSLPSTQGPITVTISIGASVARSEDSVRSLTQRANALVKQSKTAGKNRVSTDLTPSAKK